jgi:hypothetical protein
VGIGDVEREAGRMSARGVRQAGQVRHTITHHRITISVYEATPARPASRDAGRVGSGIRVSEPRPASATPLATPLATPPGVSSAKWVTLADLTRAGSGLALTGAARKVARLLEGRGARLRGTMP